MTSDVTSTFLWCCRASVPSATKTFPTRKKSTRIIFITVARFEIFRINFQKLSDTYCICVSCVTLPAWDPYPCRVTLYYRYPV